MLRLVELLLFLGPFIAYALWRLLAPVGGPSPRFIAVAAGLVIVVAAVLFWFSREDALPPGTSYVPAELHDGRLIPGHAVPQ